MTDEIHPVVAARFQMPKRALVLFSLLVVLCAAVWFWHETLLQDMAEAWVVSDRVGPADAVVIFGGGLGVRPFAAAEYYKKGLTKKILISNVRPDKAEMLGAVPSHTALNRRVLLKLGVPETAIEVFGPGMSNTYQEAIALRDWAVHAHIHSVIVPTQAFSTRRVRWIVKHELAGTEVEVEVPALDDTKYGLSKWWKDDNSIIEFQNEVIKYVYYRFKY